MTDLVQVGSGEIMQGAVRLTKQATVPVKPNAGEASLSISDETPGKLVVTDGDDGIAREVGGAAPYWTKLDVTYTQVQVDGVTKTVVLIALPINAWVHALAWKAPANWAPAAGEWEAGTLEFVLTLKDEDGVKVFLSEGVLGTISGGAWVPAALEGAAGQVPQRFSSSVTKNLVAVFTLQEPA